MAQLINTHSCAPLFSREASPTLLRNAFTPFTDELWRMFVAACRSKALGRIETELRLYLEHDIAGFVDVFDAVPFFPTVAHGSFEDYAAHLGRVFNGKRFGFVVNNLHLYDFDFWHASFPFFRQLFAKRGVPKGGVSFDLFLGNYRRTPFGIHKDSQDVYTWVLGGKKRFCLWPFERFAGRKELTLAYDELEKKDAQIRVQDEAEYRALIDEAITLEGEPGDLMFWPASFWHVADNPEGSLALTVAAGLQFDGDIIAAKGGTKQEATLAVKTACHFFHVPAPLDPQPLREDAVLRARSPVAWKALSKNEWVIAANGHVTTIAAPPKILEQIAAMFRRLNRKTDRSVHDLLKGIPLHARDAALGLLALLVSWRQSVIT